MNRRLQDQADADCRVAANLFADLNKYFKAPTMNDVPKEYLEDPEFIDTEIQRCEKRIQMAEEAKRYWEGLREKLQDAPK